ncbi:MAG: tetratricopeptide repeat protein, partial [Cyanobacteria bacterium P01_A01_bin.40]
MNDQSNPEKKSDNKDASRNIEIGEGNYIETVRGNFYQVEGNLIQNPEPKPNLNTPSNLNRSGAANFVGRSEKLQELHQLLQQNKQVTISAISGMGGIGKSELALQYALTYQDNYQGSLCWFSMRGKDLVTQIIEFAGIYFNIFPPKERKSDLAKVNYCWQNWRSEPSLIVLDDVTDFGKFYRELIAPYLPPATCKIKVLMTSRERPGNNISRIDLYVLTEDNALKLLESFIGESRIKAEPELAKELCQWLGYLPLGLELVGRYIDLDDNLTIERTLKRLKRKKLEALALLNPEQADMNAQLGVAAAFDLSWDVLDSEAQELGCYLSLFNSEPFKWSWVEAAWIESSDEDEREDAIEDLEQLRNKQLTQRNLLQAIPDSQAYQLHSLIAQYFRSKLEERSQATELKQKFCVVMNQIARSISFTPTLEEISTFSISVPHLKFTAQELTQCIDDESLIFSYEALGRFYQGQGLYSQAQLWREESLNICRERLGTQHLDVANSLNNLALLYSDQGKYGIAESYYQKALELRQQLLGEQHPDVATSLNNLAEVYRVQGKYEIAELYYQQSLELRQKLLEPQHPDLAQSFNNLALLYSTQRKYGNAEPLYLQALETQKQLTGEQHPHVATILNNLTVLYLDQERYEEAESLSNQALEMRKQLLGSQHPHVAQSLSNLASIYLRQGRYEEAEPLFLQALEMRKQLLGSQHPDVVINLNDLALLYQSQRRYEAAEPLLLKALELEKQLLGSQHPDVVINLNDLALLYQSQRRYEAAEPLLLKALELEK